MRENSVMSDASGPGVRVPPPLFFVGGWIAAWLLSRWKPLAIDGAGASGPQVAVGTALVAAGLVLMGWALVTFRRARTPIIPMFPARLVVDRGPFGLTRNPMYLGLTMGYVGLAAVLNQSWPIVLLPVVLIALTKLVIAREEAHLTAAFGDEYRRYSARVRRWM